MKKFCVLLIILFGLALDSCQNSQFSTTSRQSRNGKVTYNNRYLSEISMATKVNSRKRKPGSGEMESISRVNATVKRNELMEGMTRIGADKSSEVSLILASSSKNQLFPFTGEIKMINPRPDTSENKTAGKKKNSNNPTPQIIRFRDGHEEKAWIDSWSRDTLKYKLISEPNILRTIIAGKIDTIWPDTSYHEKQVKEQGENGNETIGKKGLLFSIMGFIPIVGLPFAILGIIYGFRALQRIKLRPDLKSDKKNATASIIIGFLALIFNIFIMVLLFSALAAACSSSVSSCSSGFVLDF